MLTGETEQLNLNQKIILGVKDREYDNGWKWTVQIIRKKYLTMQLVSGRWTMTKSGLQRWNKFWERICLETGVMHTEVGENEGWMLEDEIISRKLLLVKTLLC
jgi:hypothetical protein